MGSRATISETEAMDLTLRAATLIMAGISLLLDTSGAHFNPLVSTCPGEGSRYGDFKCIHDRTHRVCAKLVDNTDNSCTEVRWPMGTSRRICSAPNPGDSWCICMWASANIVAEVGCHNFEINCSATDVNYVLNSRYDGGWNLQNFKSCLREKCVRQSDGRYLNRA